VAGSATRRFAEASEEGRLSQERMLARARAAGMRLIGPNSMGGISFEHRISATFTAINMHTGRNWPPLGAISIASQSGFVGSHLMALLRDRGLGVAKWLATGNQADIDLADCIENLANDSITKIIVLYLEGAGRPDALRRSFDLAREKGKPIVALKAGRTEAGARAVASHTASMLGGAAAFEAVFRRHGVHEAQGVDELVDVVAALDTGRTPRGRTLGVCTVSGGIGILIADEASRRGFELPELAGRRQQILRSKYPLVTTRNPVDVGTFVPFIDATEQLLGDNYGALALAFGHFGLMEDRMDDLHVDLMLPQRVEDHLVLEAEARGKDDRSADLTAHQVQSLIERQRRERGRERRRPRPQFIRWKRLASGGQRRIERSNWF